MNNTFDISNISNESLEQYRLMADPVADKTVSLIIESGFTKEINQVLMTLMRNDSVGADTFLAFDPALAKILTEYFSQTSRLPEWADPALIAEGERVFSLFGPEIFMLLNVSSLPLCYTCAKGAKVLYDTGRLLSHNNDMDPLARRLMETAQMVVNVMAPGGLAAGGKGIVTIQKVRLIHASIRYYLKNKQYDNTTWDVAELGEPINQEDLAGTLMSFGPVIISGLKQLNVQFSEKQVQSYIHCWKVVGHLMGIHQPLLPDTYDEAFALAVKILKHQAVASDEGKALAASCIGFINYIIPGNSFDDLPSYMMQFFLKEFSAASGVDLAGCIGVDTRADVKDRIALSLTRYITGKISHLEHGPFIRKISPIFNRFLLTAIVHHYNAGKAVHFCIPPSLQKDWDLAAEWSNYRSLTPDIFGNRVTWQRKTGTIIKS